MVATWVRAGMYSPTCTGRSDTTPAIGALTTASASALTARSYAARRSCKQRLGRMHRIEGRLVRRFGDLVPGFRHLQHLGRRDAAGAENLGPFVRRPGIVPVRGRGLDGGRLFVGRRRLVGVERPAHAELGARLAQRRFRPLERQRQFARLEPHERRADVHLGPDLDEHLADDAAGFGADLGLVGREQRARQVDLPLDRHPQHRGGVDRDGLGTPSLPLVRRVPASAGQHRGDK